MVLVQVVAALAQRRALPAFVAAALAIEDVTAEAIRAGDATRDVGGSLGTAATGRAFAQRLVRGARHDGA